MAPRIGQIAGDQGSVPITTIHAALTAPITITRPARVATENTGMRRLSGGSA